MRIRRCFVFYLIAMAAPDFDLSEIEDLEVSEDRR